MSNVEQAWQGPLTASGMDIYLNWGGPDSESYEKANTRDRVITLAASMLVEKDQEVA